MRYAMQNTNAARRRGSILILVVVALVLMVILGATFIQVTRVQRLAVGDQPTYIDDVLQSVVGRIKQALIDDILDEDGNYFNSEADGTPGTPETGRDEPHDYPYTEIGVLTDPDVGLPRTAYDIDGSSLGEARGGYLDDVWLASTIPTAGSEWRKITRLTDAFYATTGSDSTASWDLSLLDAGPGPGSRPVGKGVNNNFGAGTPDPLRQDMFVPIDAEYLVDADGDGIPDSRWERAPIPAINGIEYFMAVRIIDLSALLNINVATVATVNGDGETYPEDYRSSSTVKPVRGYLPTSLDISRLAARRDPTNFTTDLANLFTNLRTPNVTLATTPTPIGLGTPITFPQFEETGGTYTPGEQFNLWLDGNGAGYYGDLSRFAPAQLDLLYRGGIDITRSDNGYITNYEAQMENLLAADDATIYDSGDFLDPVPAFAPAADRTGTFQTADVERHFEGSGSLAVRVFDNIRHMITTVSGADIYAPRHGGILPTPSPALKVDVNRASFDTIRERLEVIFEGSHNGTAGTADVGVYPILPALRPALPPAYGDDSGGPAYTHADAASAASLRSPQAAAMEFALAIDAYRDDDKAINAAPAAVGTRTFYALEPTLPFLREVYLQAGYGDDGTDSDGDLDPANDWEFVADSQAVAVELGNPFDETISIGGGNPAIRIVVFQGATEVSTYEIPAGTLIDPRDPTIPPQASAFQREHLVVVSNPITAVTDIENGAPSAEAKDDLRAADGLDLDARNTGGGEIITTATPGAITFDPAIGGQITIALQVDVDGTWVTYDRLTDASLTMPVYQNVTLPLPVAATEAHVQKTIKRAGYEIQYISNRLTVPASLPSGQSVVIARDDTATNWPFDEWASRSNTAATALGPVDSLNEDQKLRARFDASVVINPATDYIYGDPDLSNVSPTAVTNGLKFQLPIANRAILSVAELGWVPMFGFYVDSANPDRGDFPQRIGAGVDSTGARIPQEFVLENFSLDFAYASYLTPKTYGGLVMDQFTTLNPAVDSVDNDDDADDDEDDERFVMGRININTVPLHIAALAAPFPATVSDAASLFAEILDYRDSLNGFASIGQLLNPPHSALDGTDPAGPGVPGMYALFGDGVSNDDVDTGSARFDQLRDLYPLPEQRPAAAPTGASVALNEKVSYQTTDDAEERMMLFQFFPQVFDTRSDIYASYILLHGYRTDRFNEGPVETARVIVIFDRSGLDNADPKVRVLGMYRYE